MIANNRQLLRKWARRGGWSVLDQAFYSGAHLALNVLLARYLEPSEYGLFAIAYTVVLIASGLPSALVFEPMSVYGSSKYRDALRPYFAWIGWSTAVLSILVAVVVVGISATFLQGGIRQALFAVSLSLPAIMLFWAGRRGFYVVLKPKSTALFSFSYFICIVAGAFALHFLDALDAYHGIFLVGAVSFFFGINCFRKLLRYPEDIVNPHSRRDFASAHWTYGKWAIGTTFLFTMSANLYVPILGYFGTFADVGHFRAFEILFLPLNHSVSALGLLLLPALASYLAKLEQDKLRRALAFTVGFFGICGLAYALLILIAGEFAIELIYGSESKYLSSLWIVPYLGVSAVVGVVSAGLSIFLRASDRPSAIFWAQSAAMITTLTICVWLTSNWGIYGLANGIILSQLSFLSVAIFFIIRLYRQRGAEK